MVSDTGTVSIRELRVGTCLLTVRLSQHRRIVSTQKRPATEMRRGKRSLGILCGRKGCSYPPPLPHFAVGIPVTVLFALDDTIDTH